MPSATVSPRSQSAAYYTSLGLSPIPCRASKLPAVKKGDTWKRAFADHEYAGCTHIAFRLGPWGSAGDLFAIDPDTTPPADTRARYEALPSSIREKTCLEWSTTLRNYHIWGLAPHELRAGTLVNEAGETYGCFKAGEGAYCIYSAGRAVHGQIETLHALDAAELDTLVTTFGVRHGAAKRSSDQNSNASTAGEVQQLRTAQPIVDALAAQIRTEASALYRKGSVAGIGRDTWVARLARGEVTVHPYGEDADVSKLRFEVGCVLRRAHWHQWEIVAALLVWCNWPGRKNRTAEQLVEDCFRCVGKVFEEIPNVEVSRYSEQRVRTVEQAIVKAQIPARPRGRPSTRAAALRVAAEIIRETNGRTRGSTRELAGRLAVSPRYARELLSEAEKAELKYPALAGHLAGIPVDVLPAYVDDDHDEAAPADTITLLTALEQSGTKIPGHVGGAERVPPLTPPDVFISPVDPDQIAAHTRMVGTLSRLPQLDPESDEGRQVSLWRQWLRMAPPPPPVVVEANEHGRPLDARPHVDFRIKQSAKDGTWSYQKWGSDPVCGFLTADAARKAYLSRTWRTALPDAPPQPAVSYVADEVAA